MAAKSDYMAKQLGIKRAIQDYQGVLAAQGISKPTTYQVKPGDTPATIAAANNITATRLLQENKYGAPFVPGQTVKIPAVPFDTRVTSERLTQTPGPLRQMVNNIAGIPRALGQWAGSLTPQPNQFAQGNPAARVGAEYGLTQNAQFAGQQAQTTSPTSIPTANLPSSITQTASPTTNPTTGGPISPYGNLPGADLLQSLGTIVDSKGKANTIKMYFTGADIDAYAANAGLTRTGALYTLRQSGYQDVNGVMKYTGQTVSPADVVLPTTEKKNSRLEGNYFGANGQHWAYDPATGITYSTVRGRARFLGPQNRRGSGGGYSTPEAGPITDTGAVQLLTWNV